MAWEAPAEDRPVWCSVGDDKTGTPTAQSVNCVTKDPAANPQVAMLETPALGAQGSQAARPGTMRAEFRVGYQGYFKFTSQEELGKFLVVNYHIRTPRELTSCEVCHR
jgi:hypothetical protein